MRAPFHSCPWTEGSTAPCYCHSHWEQRKNQARASVHLQVSSDLAAQDPFFAPFVSVPVVLYSWLPVHPGAALMPALVANGAAMSAMALEVAELVVVVVVAAAAVVAAAEGAVLVVVAAVAVVAAHFVVDVDDVDVAVVVAAVGVGTSEPALTDLQQMRLVEMGPYAEMKESIVPWPAIAAPLRGLAVPCQAL